jgi:hypothetical protein
MRIIKSAIWAQVRKATTNYPFHNIVAVPHFGYKASSLLPLKEGDALIVDLSFYNLQHGLIFPDELWKMAQRGVEIYSAYGLKTAYYITDKVGFIGPTMIQKEQSTYFGFASTNLNHLIEIDDPEDLKELRGFLEFLKRDRLPADYIWTLKKDFVWPKVPTLFNEKLIPQIFRERIYLHHWKALDEEIDKQSTWFKELRIYALRTVGRGKELHVFRSFASSRLDVESWVIIKKQGKLTPPGKVVHVENIQVDHYSIPNQIVFTVFSTGQDFDAKQLSDFSHLKLDFDKEEWFHGKMSEDLVNCWDLSFEKGWDF